MLVESARGSRNVYRYDAAAGALRLAGNLLSATTFPADSGLVLQASGRPRGPVPRRALVLLPLPSFPGCVVRSRAVGVYLRRPDDAARAPHEADVGPLLCVPCADPSAESTTSVEQVPTALLAEIAHFLHAHLDLGGPAGARAGWGWAGPGEAARLLSAGPG